MTDENKQKQRDIPARICLVLIILVLIGMAGFRLFNMLAERILRPSAFWDGSQIYVFSAKDGPWLITHLMVYRNGYWSVVAQLPNPVTILDSAGHYFSREEIDKLEWLDRKGEKQPPPVVGEQIGVMFIIPTESNRPSHE